MSESVLAKGGACRAALRSAIATIQLVQRSAMKGLLILDLLT